MAEFESLAGQLLVALPALSDPNFARTVVLVMEHTESGAVGIVLNRPTDADVLDHLPGWWTAAANPQVVFIGGPVGDGGGIGLARGEGAAPMEGWPEVLGMWAVDLEETPTVDADLEARIFMGYSGWGAGQLEEELETASWVVVPGEAGDAFTPQPERLWAAVLERSGGRHAWLATFPSDPRLN